MNKKNNKNKNRLVNDKKTIKEIKLIFVKKPKNGGIPAKDKSNINIKFVLYELFVII